MNLNPFCFLCVCVNRNTLMPCSTLYGSQGKTTLCIWKRTSEKTLNDLFDFELLSKAFLNLWGSSICALSFFRNLVGKTFSVTHYSDQGDQVSTTPDLSVCIFTLFYLSTPSGKCVYFVFVKVHKMLSTILHNHSLSDPFYWYRLPYMYLTAQAWITWKQDILCHQLLSEMFVHLSSITGYFFSPFCKMPI